MRQRIPLVLSATALAVALFGSTPLGEAARDVVSQLPPNSVGTAQLKRNSVGTAQLKRSAVTSNKVKNRSLFAVDFALGQLPKGDKGDKGDAGQAGAISTARARFDADSAADGAYERATVSCSSQEKAIAGGVSSGSVTTDVHVRESKPTNSGFEPASGETFSSWPGAIYNAPGGVVNAAFRVWVVCVT